MTKLVEELRRKRADLVANMFVARCTLALATTLLVDVFVFDKPVGELPILLLIILTPTILVCYDMLSAWLARRCS